MKTMQKLGAGSLSTSIYQVLLSAVLTGHDGLRGDTSDDPKFDLEGQGDRSKV